MGAIESTVVGVKEDFPDLLLKTRLIVYPNPSTGKTVTIHCDEPDSGKWYLVILNLLGSPVYQQEIISIDKMIDISHWPPGVQLSVVYEQGKAIERAKMIVQ